MSALRRPLCLCLHGFGSSPRELCVRTVGPQAVAEEAQGHLPSAWACLTPWGSPALDLTQHPQWALCPHGCHRAVGSCDEEPSQPSGEADR